MGISDLDEVRNIVVKTISGIYPHYYPEGAVEFFLTLHSKENIEEDMKNGFVYLCIDTENTENTIVGTVTIKQNHICRLFVLPEYQGKGYGRELMDYAEDIISGKFSEIILDASLPAKKIYLKRGYEEIEYHTIETDNGDHLCYDIMRKIINK